MKLKIGYFGTPQFSAELLKKILIDPGFTEIEVSLVVTQPDKPVGRKKILTPSPVKVVALDYAIPVIEYGGEGSELASALSNCDLALVYAFGEIIPAKLLEKPRYGFWNIHPSLLPLYRGPSPMATPLMEGASVTGVTLIKMDEKMDHGPIILQREYVLSGNERRPDLERELTKMGLELFREVIVGGIGNVEVREQDHAKATYTKLLKRDDGFVELSVLNEATNGKGGKKVYNLFRGLFPWPGMWTIKDEKRMKIIDCALENDTFVIKSVQIEGKRATSGVNPRGGIS